MVESLYAGYVKGRLFIIIWSFGLRLSRICRVEALDAGEIQGRFSIIIWSLGLR